MIKSLIEGTRLKIKVTHSRMTFDPKDASPRPGELELAGAPARSRSPPCHQPPARGLPLMYRQVFNNFCPEVALPMFVN